VIELCKGFRVPNLFSRAIWLIPLARAISPNAAAMSVGSPSSRDCGGLDQGLAITHINVERLRVRTRHTHCLDVSMKAQRSFVKARGEATKTLLTSWTNSIRAPSDSLNRFLYSPPDQRFHKLVRLVNSVHIFLFRHAKSDYSASAGNGEAFPVKSMMRRHLLERSSGFYAV
jgi:hypothetical protein